MSTWQVSYKRIFGKEYFDVEPRPPVLKMLIDQTSTDTILTHT